MTGWVLLIVALMGGVGALMRLALQYVVAIWSLKNKDGHQHAIALLKVLQNDKPTMVDRLRLFRAVTRLGDAFKDTSGEDHT